MTECDERGRKGHKFDDGEARAAREYLMEVAQAAYKGKQERDLDERVLTSLARRDELFDTGTVVVMWTLMRTLVRCMNRLDNIEMMMRRFLRPRVQDEPKEPM